MSKAIDFLWSKREDMLLFALSLIISLLLFGQLQIGLEPGREREFEVPLSITGQSEDTTIVQAPRTIKVIASGSQRALDALNTSNVRATVDLSGVEPGVARLPVSVVGPLNSTLDFNAVRTSVEVEVEERAEREFDVQLSTDGTPPGNYTYDGVTLIPSTVTISGAASNVPNVTLVRAVLDLTKVSPNQSLDVEVEALDKENKPVALITITPPTIRVLPAVSIGPSRRILIVTPIFTGQPAIGFKITGYEVSPSQIATVGGSANVSRVTTVDTEPINLGGLRSNRNFKVKLVLPRGLTAPDGDEVTISVRIVRV